MDELCEKINRKVTKTAISCYENGKMMPESSVVIALANALNVKIDYFFRPFTVSLNNVSFRKKAKLNGQKAVKAIQEKINDRIERYIEIESIFSIVNNFSTNFSNISVCSESDVYALAKRLRNEWNLGEDSIVNVVEMLEEHEIKVIEIDADKKFDGLSGFVENVNIPIIVLNKDFDIERKRFTALHELAHILLHFDELFTEKEKEKMCNLFASEVLIPKETFIKLIGSSRSNISLQELKPIQQRYGISVRALMYKAKELNIITENRYLHFCKTLSFDKQFAQAVDESMGGNEHSERFERLVFRALASELITTSKAAVLLNTDIETVRNDLKIV
jgi:Zn-dependent peptidase ImmA (M78 family)/DNA-binding XRE family transcriptional regulator